MPAKRHAGAAQSATTHVACSATGAFAFVVLHRGAATPTRNIRTPARTIKFAQLFECGHAGVLRNTHVPYAKVHWAHVEWNLYYPVALAKGRLGTKIVTYFTDFLHIPMVPGVLRSRQICGCAVG